MARDIVKTYYAKVLRTEAIDDDEDIPMMAPGQLEEYNLVRESVKKALKDGLFLVGGKDEQVRTTPYLSAMSDNYPRAVPIILLTLLLESSV